MAWEDNWIRTNVLIPIFLEHYSVGIIPEDPGPAVYVPHTLQQHPAGASQEEVAPVFSFTSMTDLIEKYALPLKQIGKEIYEFVNPLMKSHNEEQGEYVPEALEFWAYYCNYDWVVFCWIFGKMMDLPAGFPMFCHDLKVLMIRKSVKLRGLKILKVSKDD